MRYIANIESRYSGLTKSEKKIADFVKSNVDKVIYMSINEITEAVGVGDATVVRFCKKIGYNGFQEFKIELAKEDFIQEKKDDDDIIKRIENNHINSLKKGSVLIELSSVKEFIKQIKKADNVFFYGVGASGLAAKEAELAFFRAGLSSTAIIDPHFQMMNSSVIDEKSLLVSISLSGTTQDIYESTKLAKENGAYIVVITSSSLSPIAEIADIVFTNPSIESAIEGGSLIAKIAQLYIIDILCTSYIISEKETAIDTKEKMAKSIIGKSLAGK